MTDPELIPFVPRFPWWGGDLQTLRNRLVHRARPLPGISEERLFPLDDGTGDRMLARLDTPEGGGTGPLVVLIHGLMGCDHSAYMLESARFHLARGRRVLRLNLRGAGPSAKYATRFYFAGCWRDIVAVLEGMVPEAAEYPRACACDRGCDRLGADCAHAGIHPVDGAAQYRL
jgi:predicted alpha/beta-fold hydrolase